MAEEDRGFWGNLFGRRDNAPRDIPVDFFSLPMDANPEEDDVVGEGDFGPVYQTVRGQRYQIRPTSTERSYESEPGTLDRVAEVGRGAIEGAIDGAISGVTAPARAARGEDMTYGDAFETAGMTQAAGAASPISVYNSSRRTDPTMLIANRDATTGIMATQAGSDVPTPRDFGFTRDNPGGDWLRNKQERADQSMAESSRGLGRRGITGSVTGTMGMFQDMFLPTDRLSGLTGLMDERRVPGDSNFDALMARVREEGFDPNQDGNKIVIAVNHRGEPFVLEGNTRIAVARELGVPNVRAEVRYWNGAEQVDGPFSPDNVAQIAAPEPLPTAQPQEFNRGGLVLSDATKGIRTREGMEMANNKFQLDRSKADQDGDGEVSKLEEVQGEAAQRTVGKDDLVEMACGGIMMPDMELDPVSGNEVPLGSTPENVRDDIPAMLSQDEYVLPAHVVKWHGLKHIQEMQMEAEAGLMSMAMEGLIGGVEEAAEEEADEDDTMEDEYVEDMDVEVDVPTVEVEDELEGEEYEEEPLTSTLPGMMKKQKYAFIIS